MPYNINLSNLFGKNDDHKKKLLLTEYELRNMLMTYINRSDPLYAPSSFTTHPSTQFRYNITDIRGPPNIMIMNSLREKISFLLFHPDNIYRLKNIADDIMKEIGGIGIHSEMYTIISEVLENNDTFIKLNYQKMNLFEMIMLLNKKIIQHIKKLFIQHRVANANYIRYISNSDPTTNISLNPHSLSSNIINQRKKITYHNGGLQVQHNRYNNNSNRLPQRPSLAR